MGFILEPQTLKSPLGLQVFHQGLGRERRCISHLCICINLLPQVLISFSVPLMPLMHLATGKKLLVSDSKVWCPDQQLQHHLGTCQKCRLSAPIPQTVNPNPHLVTSTGDSQACYSLRNSGLSAKHWLYMYLQTEARKSVSTDHSELPRKNKS